MGLILQSSIISSPILLPYSEHADLVQSEVQRRFEEEKLALQAVSDGWRKMLWKKLSCLIVLLVLEAGTPVRSCHFTKSC